MISLLLIAAHMVGDYVVQTDWMASNKLQRWDVRAIHVSCYTACFVPIALAYAANVHMAVLFLQLVWITHFVADSRRWASSEKWPPKPILVDQSIHLATLAVLGVIFFGL